MVTAAMRPPVACPRIYVAVGILPLGIILLGVVLAMFGDQVATLP